MLIRVYLRDLEQRQMVRKADGGQTEVISTFHICWKVL